MINKLNEIGIKELIKNRTIALICPSKCVVNSRQKDFIESHDLIVRINRQHPVPLSLVPDIGQRTDVLYNSNLGDVSDNLFESLHNGYLNDIKCVCYPEDSAITKKFEDEVVEHDKTITCHALPYDITLSMMRQAKNWNIICPNQQHNCFVGHTGTIALYHILQCDPKEVYITGMTFYREPYFEGYKETNHNPSKEEQKQIWDKWDNNEIPRRLHNIDMDAEIEFFKKLKQNYNIKTDAVMSKLFP